MSSERTPSVPGWRREVNMSPSPSYDPRTPDSWGSLHDEGMVMQEGGPKGYGSLAAEHDGRKWLNSPR